MARISLEQLNDITVFRVVGKLLFDEFADAITTNYHTVTNHIIWDFSDANIEGINQDEFRTILTIAKECRPFSKRGKTAYVSNNGKNYLVSCLFAIMATSMIQYPYRVFRSVDEALEWLQL